MNGFVLFGDQSIEINANYNISTEKYKFHLRICLRMSFTLSSYNIDKNRRINLATIVLCTCTCTVLCFFVIYTSTSLITATNNFHVGERSNDDTINNLIVQNRIKNKEQSESNVPVMEQQMQELPLRTISTSTQKTPSTTKLAISVMDELPCMEKSIIDIARKEIASEMKYSGYLNEIIELSQLTLETNGKPVRNGEMIIIFMNFELVY